MDAHGLKLRVTLPHPAELPPKTSSRIETSGYTKSISFKTATAPLRSIGLLHAFMSETTMQSAKQRAISLLLAAWLLTACGGGGADRVDPDPIATPTTARAFALAATSSLAPTPKSPRSPIGGVVGSAWSNPATWGGSVPPEGASVVIPSGLSITLDRNVRVGNLVVEGRLAFARVDIELQAESIVVRGEGGVLQVGSQAEPFAQLATITLLGSVDSPDVPGCGARALCVMGGGTLDLHGLDGSQRSFTRIDGHLNSGATQMRLSEPVAWRSGSELVLTTTSFSAMETERLRITAVSTDGREVSFQPALRFDRWGQRQTYEGQEVDQRAFAGLLSRNVVIRSAPGTVDAEIASDTCTPLSTGCAESARRFGGHVMIMGGARAFVDGVEFRQLGQETRLGRYAFHWHLNGPSTGQFVRNSSVNTTFTRGIVMHGTDDALAENNVVFNAHSHGIAFAEDGSEMRSRVRNNLVADVVRLPAARRIFQRDVIDPNDRGDRTQDEMRPSAYWGLSANHVLIDNVVAGVRGGNGFHIDTAGIKNLSRTDRDQVIRGNFATGVMNTHYGGNDRYPPLAAGHGFFMTSRHTPVTLVDSQAFKSYGGVWFESSTQSVMGARLADNAVNVVSLGGMNRMHDALLVARTANTRVGSAPQLLMFSDNLPRVGNKFERTGHLSVEVNQGQSRGLDFRSVTVVGQRAVALPIGQNLLPGSKMQGMRFVNVANRLSLQVANPTSANQTSISSGFLDLDGSVVGTGIGREVRGINAATAACELRPDWFAAICPLP